MLEHVTNSNQNHVLHAGVVASAHYGLGTVHFTEYHTLESGGGVHRGLTLSRSVCGIMAL